MGETVLKKEFRHSDVERIRNIVKKDFGGQTKIQTGYEKKQDVHKEGEVWEENGKQWTIKKGIKQNITKLDLAKKLLQVPLRCPKCGGSMEHHLAKKMYYIHGFCFECTIKYEDLLKRAGLYKQYEKQMMSGNIKGFIRDTQDWIYETIDEKAEITTEDGVMETWGGMNKEYKAKILGDLEGYISLLSTHLD